MGLGGETFASIDFIYGGVVHIYGIHSKSDKKNVVLGEKRKDFSAG